MEKVSIIMPAFNASKTISESIKSVLNQSYKDFKLYIIDDCSTDNTVDIIKYFSDPRIVLHENPVNIGVAGTRNVGLSLAEGDVIAFLDSDDIWLECKLDSQLELIGSYDVITSGYYFFSSQSDVDGVVQPKEFISIKDMYKSNYIGNLTGIYNARKLGKFYQKQQGHEDYIMWLEVMSVANEAYCIQKPLAKYRIGTKSLSANKLKAMRWQWLIYRKNLGFNFIQSVYYFVFYVLNALKKRTKS